MRWNDHLVRRARSGDRRRQEDQMHAEGEPQGQDEPATGTEEDRATLETGGDLDLDALLEDLDVQSRQSGSAEGPTTRPRQGRGREPAADDDFFPDSRESSPTRLEADLSPDATIDLDRFLSELRGEAQTESVEMFRSRVGELLASIQTRVATDPGGSPQGAAPQPIIPHLARLEGVLLETCGQLRQTPMIRENVNAGIVQHMITRGTLPNSLEQVTRAVNAVRELYGQLSAGSRPVDAGGDHGAIAREMVSEEEKLKGLRRLVGDETLDIPLPQAAALIAFLDAYPRFWTRLAQGMTGIRFNSSRADDRGGGVFDLTKDRAIDISRLPTTPPGAYVRLLVHETGHATFESILLNRQSIPYELDTEKVSEMLALFREAQTPIDQHHLRERAEKRNELSRYWDTMSPSAKTYYQAWRTLRQGDGCHLLGLDLWQDQKGNRLSPSQRRRYQAGNFSEFCAETFMQYAMGDLHPHVQAMLTGDGAGAQVKTAWQDVWGVLERVASPILRGDG